MRNSVEAGMEYVPLHEQFPIKKPMTETELSARIEEIESQRIDRSTQQVNRKTGHRYRRQMRTQKTARLRTIVTSSYVPHAGYVQWECVDGEWIPAGKYIKYPKNSKRQKWCKRETSKIMRNSTEVSGKGNFYRRLFDYWWTLY